MSLIRIFEQQPLKLNKTITIDKTHYITNVMRKKTGDDIIVINGSGCEFLGQITKINKKNIEIVIKEKTKQKKTPEFLGLIFAPIHKQDILVKHSVELGITEFLPYKAQYGQTKFNIDKDRLNIIEALEQCERLDFPVINQQKSLKEILTELEQQKKSLVFFCEERTTDTLNLKQFDFSLYEKYYILVGCEGGFSPQEKQMIKTFDCVKSISLGENILRTETAVASSISIIQYLKTGV